VRIGPGPPLQYRLASKSRPRRAHGSNRTAATKHCRHPGFGRHLTCMPPLPYPLIATTKGGRKSFFFFHEAAVLCALLSPLLPLLPCCPSTCHHAGRALPSPSSKSQHQPGVLLRKSSCREELCRSVSANRSDSDVLQQTSTAMTSTELQSKSRTRPTTPATFPLTPRCCSPPAELGLRGVPSLGEPLFPFRFKRVPHPPELT
jgi:hypothetical protein